MAKTLTLKPDNTRKKMLDILVCLTNFSTYIVEHNLWAYMASAKLYINFYVYVMVWMLHCVIWL